MSFSGVSHFLSSGEFISSLDNVNP